MSKRNPETVPFYYPVGGASSALLFSRVHIMLSVRSALSQIRASWPSGGGVQVGAALGARNLLEHLC